MDTEAKQYLEAALRVDGRALVPGRGGQKALASTFCSAGAARSIQLELEDGLPDRLLLLLLLLPALYFCFCSDHAMGERPVPIISAARQPAIALLSALA
jgi:hypothetical protein